MIGGSAIVANAIFPANSSVLVGAVLLTAGAALFISLLTDVLSLNIVDAIINKERADQIGLLTGVIGKTLYKVIEDEKTKKD